MTAAEFRALLDRAGLKQVQVGRLVEALTGMKGPDSVAINRYCRGRLRVDAAVAALVELYARQPKAVREALLSDSV